MSDTIKAYKTKLIKSLLNLMGADLLRRQDVSKPEITSEDFNKKIDDILDKYTADISSQVPFSPIAFSEWISRIKATPERDSNGNPCWRLRGGRLLDSKSLYNNYLTDYAKEI